MRELNSDIEFVNPVAGEELVFQPISVGVCQFLCSNWDVDFVKDGCSHSLQVGPLGVPCSKQKVVADGNCFFRAVSQAVSGSQKHPRKIRLAVCKELERNAERYSGFLRCEYSTVLEYIQQSEMRCMNTWATEVEIHLTADWLGISVFTFHEGRW